MQVTNNNTTTLRDMHKQHQLNQLFIIHNMYITLQPYNKSSVNKQHILLRGRHPEDHARPEAYMIIIIIIIIIIHAYFRY